jgi:hypothetical protein
MLVHGGYVVHKDLVGRGCVGVGEHVTLHSVYWHLGGVLLANTVLLESVVEVDVVVGGEVWVKGDPNPRPPLVQTLPEMSRAGLGSSAPSL